MASRKRLTNGSIKLMSRSSAIVITVKRDNRVGDKEGEPDKKARMQDGKTWTISVFQDR